MIRIMILSLAVFIAGCGTINGNYPKFPDYPGELGEPCSELQLIKDNEEKLSEVLKVVTVNYGQYHECRAKVQSWIEWHKKQKENRESIK